MTGSSSTSSKPRRRSVWRTIIILLFGLVLAGIAVLALFVAMPPTGLLNSQLVKLVEERTGRTLSIKGASRYKFWPKLTARLENVTLSNPPGMDKSPPFLRVGAVDVDLHLMPLIRGEKEPGRPTLTRLSLSEPRVHLLRDKAGKENWQFEATAAKTGDGQALLAQLLPFGEIKATKGKVSYSDESVGGSLQLDDVDFVAKSKGDAGAVDAVVDAQYLGEPLHADIALGDVTALIGGAETNSTVKLTLGSSSIDFDGSIGGGETPKVAGAVKIGSPSVDALAQRLGLTLPEALQAQGETQQAVSIESQISWADSVLAFEETKASAGDVRTSGRGQLNLSGERPALRAELESEQLDFSGYFEEQTPGAQPGVEAAATPEAVMADIAIEPDWDGFLEGLERAKAGDVSDPESIDLQERAIAAAAPQIPPWNDKALFDADKLKVINLDVTLKAKTIKLADVMLQDAEIKTDVNNGKLGVALNSSKLGDGTASGNIEIDAGTSPPKISAGARLKAVEMAPVSKLVTGQELLVGKSNLTFTSTASGLSVRDIVRSLEGSSQFEVGKGSVAGVNVSNVISNPWKKWAFNPKARTGFDRIKGQYKINKGIVRSSPELSVQSRKVGINSRGDVRMPSKWLLQRVRLELLPSLWRIPVKVQGYWAKPSFQLDWSSIFFQPEAFSLTSAQAPDDADLPAHVREAVKRALDIPEAESGLSGDQRAFLRALIKWEPPPEPAATPEPPDAPASAVEGEIQDAPEAPAVPAE